MRGNRVVVNKSVDGSATIMSPFNSSDIAHADGECEIVEVGDLVKITGKKYYSGSTIPQWVLERKWYVYKAQDGNDRVVINKSEDGKCSIMSPINRNNLKIVKKHQ